MKANFPTFHHYAFAAIVLWATSYVVTKLIMGSFSAGSLALVRCLVATVILALVMKTKGMAAPKVREWARFVPTGLIGLSLYSIFFNQGSALSNPSTVCVVIATAPVLTAVLAFFLFKEKLHPLAWLAIVLAFAGILVMSLWEMSADINLGVVWTAAAAVTLAVYNLTQRDLARTYQPLQISTLSFAVGTFFLLYFLPPAVREIAKAPALHNALALYLGVFPSAVAYLAWVKALSLTPKTSYVANYMFLTPVLATLMEIAVIHRYPDAATVVGGLVIAASLVLFFIAGKKSAAKA